MHPGGRPSRLAQHLILALALALPGPTPAAAFACAKPAASGEEQRMEESPDSDDRERDFLPGGKDLQAWLKRLVGQYTIGGVVDLCGKGNARDQRPVRGYADCIASGLAPAIHCKVNATWSAAYEKSGAPVLGGASNLAPAEFLFGMEIPANFMSVGKGPNGWGLSFLQLDSNGDAEWASGELLGDTFYSREPCSDIPGNCHKTRRITAKPDSDEISMQVDVTIDRQRVLRQAFQLRRKPNVPQDDERSTGSPP